MSKKKQNATESELVNFVNARAARQKRKTARDQAKAGGKAQQAGKPEIEKKTAKGKTGKAAKTDKAAKTGKPKTSPVNIFGSRVGSKVAQVDAMLSKTKPIKMKAIKAIMGDTFYNHIGDLMKKGLVLESKEGYKIK